MQSKELMAWKEVTAIVKREATDLVNVPIVRDGYAMHGKPHALVFTNLHAMAISRFHKHFPFSNIQDPYMDRILAEIKKLCATCIVKKYEAQRDHIKYDHLKEATRIVDEWIKNSIMYNNLRIEYNSIIGG